LRTFPTLESVVAQTLDGRIVAIADGQQISHARFRDDVAAWHDAFAAQTGSRWALYFEDALTFAAALLGAWQAGKVIYLCGDNLPATLHRMNDHVDGYAGDMEERFLPLQPVAGAVAPAAWPSLDREQARLYLQTSGSTGMPALVCKRLRQLDEEVGALERQFAPLFCASDATSTVVHGTVSHQHIYGLLFRVLWPLACGRPFASRLFGHAELADVLGGGDGVLVTSPAHLKRLPVDLDWSGARHFLRAVFSSGGPLDDHGSAHAWAVLGVAPVEILGSSETGGIAFRRRTPADHSAHAWQALPGVEWRIEGDQLEVKSAFLPDSDWLRTEDRVVRDSEHAFRLIGRADRVVKIEERRVSLTALETAIGDHPMVQQVRVLALEGDSLELGAVVMPTDEGWRQLELLGRWRFAQTIKAALASVADATLHPQRWRYVTTFPINAQGKVTQQLLQTLFRGVPEPLGNPVDPCPSLLKEPQ